MTPDAIGRDFCAGGTKAADAKAAKIARKCAAPMRQFSFVDIAGNHLVGDMPNAFGLCRVRPPQPPHKPRRFVKHVLDGRDRSAHDDPRGPGASGSC